MCTVRFRMDYEVEIGQRIFVIGSPYELGEWDLSRAVPMQHSTEQGTLSLVVGSTPSHS